MDTHTHIHFYSLICFRIILFPVYLPPPPSLTQSPSASVCLRDALTSLRRHEPVP